jgi:poly(3-hydroxybutyrate) depolymerase
VPKQLPKVLLISALLGLLGCGDDGSATPGPGVADGGTISPDGGAISTQDCSGRAAKDSGVVTRSIQVGGVERSYELSIPANYDASQPARLVFGWHGLGGDGALLRLYTNVEGASQDAAGNDATIFAYPDGLLIAEYGATAWELADAAFFDAMVGELSAELCIDSSRIFSFGHSFGGYFSNVLGCLRGNTLRAIAPVAGGLLAGLNTCESAMPVWLAHATDDPTVPVAQGRAARDKWIAENQCSQTTASVAPSPCEAYSECQSGAQVVWCETASGGHNWPGYANVAIWEFFASFAPLRP